MRIINEYPHFKGPHLDRAESLERFIVDELINSPLTDEERESSAAWELMHSSSCKAIMHIMAEKRGIPPELARIAGALHDYYVIKTGKYKNHARLGAPLVREIMVSTGNFSVKEIDYVVEMVENHSDKHICSEHDHVELIKDVDVFDCSLYNGTEIYYLTIKPLPVCREYFQRILKVRNELGMPMPNEYNCLELGMYGSLVSCDSSVGVETTEPGVSVQAILLWALSRITSKNMLLVYYDGKARHWYGPANLPTAPVGELSWEVVGRTYAQVVGFGQKLSKRWLERSVTEVFDELRAFVAATFPVFDEIPALREASARMLSDYTCDPQADENLDALVEQQLKSNSDVQGALATLQQCAADLGGNSDDNRFPQFSNSIPESDWELSEAQQEALEQLAQLEGLNMLRKGVISVVQTALEYLSKHHQRDFTNRFPFTEFGSEPIDIVPDSNTTWIAISWPGFRNFEFLVGEEATQRFENLKTYWKHEAYSMVQ